MAKINPKTRLLPYYYLALCYVDLQQWDKAAQNRQKARPTLTRPLTAKFLEIETKVKTASNDPRAPMRNAAFDSGARQAEAALGNRNCEAALRQFDQLARARARSATDVKMPRARTSRSIFENHSST